MGIQRSRERLGAKGLGRLYGREVLPTPGASHSDFGFLDETNLDHVTEMEVIPDEAGYVIDAKEKSSIHRLSSNLLQVSADEIDFIKGASGKIHDLQYFGVMNEYGLFHYYCFEQVRIDPSVSLGKKQGKQVLPLKAIAVKQGELAYDVPEHYFIQTNGRMYLDDLALWICPRRGWNAATTKLLDASGFARHGDLNAVGLWQAGTTPPYLLRFDGSDDYATFGDILDIGANAALIEFWVTIKGANASLQEILTKKTTSGTSSDAGFWIERTTSNTLKAYFSDGTNQATIESTGTLLQNAKHHVMIEVQRTGILSKIFIDGAVDEADTDLSGVTGSITNAVALYLARGGSGYGQIDLDDVRIFLKATDFTDAATRAAAHYAAEHALLGV